MLSFFWQIAAPPAFDYWRERTGVKELITNCAEKIVELLGKTREVNIMNLCESISERSVVGYQALGWLAHDGRISYRRQGNQVYVSLSAAPEFHRQRQQSFIQRKEQIR